MRITGGVYRGRQIRCPAQAIRPAMARMRESLFSILAQRVVGARFLDLFAGSGLMALEAASRGAVELTLVEADRAKQAILRHNLTLLRQGERAKLWLEPVERFLVKRPPQPYPLVYADPPFAFPQKERILQLVAAHSWLARGGVLILHHPYQDPIPPSIAAVLHQYDRRRYGGSALSFYRRPTVDSCPTLL